MPASKTRYDRVPYPGGVFAPTHPDHLATLATLCAVEAAPPDRCRVLELGCAQGYNLLPLALTLPDSTFVGVDASEVQIQQGKTTRDSLGIRNLTLVCSDLREFTDPQRFDYVICHGVYSWVAPEVQRFILERIGALLAPRGVAVVSYNVLPGWYHRLQVRDLALYHAANFDDPQDQIDQTRAMLSWLAKGSVAREPHYAAVNAAHHTDLSTKPDAYLFHEYLAPYNAPMYFHQFVSAAAEHGLQYLVDSELSTMFPTDVPEEARADLERIAPDLIRTEQYLDFLRNRGFRMSLLVQSSLNVDRALTWSRLLSLRVTANFGPTGGSLDDASEVVFVLAGEGTPLRCEVPLVKVALQHLAQTAPASVPFVDLVDLARQRTGSKRDLSEDRDEIGSTLLTCLMHDFVLFRTTPEPFCGRVTECPLAHELTRLQAAQGPVVSTFQHRTQWIEPLDQHLLQRLDGLHCHEQIVASLAVTDLVPADRDAATLVQEKLVEYAGCGLLIG